MDELSSLRQEALGLADQSQIDSVIESIDFWEPALKKFIDYGQLLEWCGRAIADVTHEIAAEKYGWESAEADAVFDGEDRKLSELLRWIDQHRNQHRSNPVVRDQS